MKRHQESADPIALSREFDSLARALWRAVAHLDDEEASHQPSPGEWSVKQILLHLLGPAPHGYFEDAQRVLHGEQPSVALDPAMAQYRDARLFLRTTRLASLVVHEYQRIADLCATLSLLTLSRCVRVEELPEADGERPTVAEYLGALLAHLQAHLRQIEETLGRDRRTSQTEQTPDSPRPTSIRRQGVCRPKVA
jgi:hypothetical protein